MILSLVVLLLILCATLYYLKKKSNRNYWKKKNVFQLDDLSFKFMFGKRSLSEIFKDIYNQNDEPYIGTHFGSIPSLIVKKSEDIQAVLAGDFQSFHSRGININENDVLANNLLFTNDYQRWKILRQKLSPVFTSAKLKNMFYIMEKCARDFADFVKDNPLINEKPFNVLYTYTTASIGAAVFGIDTGSKNTMNSPFMDMAWKSLEPSFYTNCVATLSNISPTLMKLLNLKIFGEHEKFFVGAVKSVLEERRGRQTTDKNNDFIDICLDLQKQGLMEDSSTGFTLKPTDELMAAQAFFFFIAGTDTSANTMHFTLLELSNNPKILAKIHKEIDSVFENNAKELSWNDVEQLHYLDMVINEAMRKYPPIGIIQRLCAKDTVLPTGNLKIEKDTVVFIPIFALHRDERYYPNPEVFDPERFAPENVSNIPKYVYLPFGEGNRICIGSRFARLQVKAGLAWLLRRFTLKPQNVEPKTFEASPFAIRDPTLRYEFVPRDL